MIKFGRLLMAELGGGLFSLTISPHKDKIESVKQAIRPDGKAVRIRHSPATVIA